MKGEEVKMEKPRRSNLRTSALLMSALMAGGLLSAVAYGFDTFAPRDRSVSTGFWDPTDYVQSVPVSEAPGVMTTAFDAVGSLSDETSDFDLDHCSRTMDISDLTHVRRHPPTGGLVIIR